MKYRTLIACIFCSLFVLGCGPHFERLDRKASGKLLRVNNKTFAHSWIKGEAGGSLLGWSGSIEGKSDSDAVKISIKYEYMGVQFYEDLILTHAEYISLLADTDIKETGNIELLVLPNTEDVRNVFYMQGEVYLKLSNRLLFVSRAVNKDPLATYMSKIAN